MTRYRIGLVGELDHLRPHLQGADFSPRGGPFGHAATSEIDSLMGRGPNTPLLVSARQGDPTWNSWLRRLLSSGARVVVIGHLPMELQDQPCRRVNSSASLADALIACGASSAMVPDNLASVPLTAPKAERIATGLGAWLTPAQNGFVVDHPEQGATLDPPIVPRRRASSPADPAEDSGADSSPDIPAPAFAAEPLAQMPFARHAHTSQPSVSASAPNTITPAPTPSALLHDSSEPAPQKSGTVPIDPSVDQRVPHIPVSPQRTSVVEIFDQPDGQNPHALADIIIVFGARGGLGKTSLAQAIAGTSAARGRRTVLVDANKGQGDQALLLRLDSTNHVPSAYDAACTGRAEDAISSPDLLNTLRGARRDRVDFALVAAPPESIPGAATVTTARVYRGIIDHSVRVADLVVVDTHPIAPGEPSDMVTDLLLPLLRAGAWGLGLTDSSIPGVKHLEGALDYLIERGVPQDRLMTVINRVPVTANLNMDLLGSRLSHRSHWVGPIFSDDEDVQNRSNAGIVLVDVNTMAHQVENILHRACGLEVVTAPQGEKKSRCLLGLFRRGR